MERYISIAVIELKQSKLILPWTSKTNIYSHP